MKKLSIVFFSLFLVVSVGWAECGGNWWIDLSNGMTNSERLGVTVDLAFFVLDDLPGYVPPVWPNQECPCDWVFIAQEAVRLNDGDDCDDWISYGEECTDGPPTGSISYFRTVLNARIGQLCAHIDQYGYCSLCE